MFGCVVVDTVREGFEKNPTQTPTNDWIALRRLLDAPHGVVKNRSAAAGDRSRYHSKAARISARAILRTRSGRIYPSFFPSSSRMSDHASPASGATSASASRRSSSAASPRWHRTPARDRPAPACRPTGCSWSGTRRTGASVFLPLLPVAHAWVDQRLKWHVLPRKAVTFHPPEISTWPDPCGRHC